MPIELSIVDTAKPYGKAQKFYTFHEEIKYFKDLKEAMKFINETYGKHKRSKLYVDRDKKSVHCGYVIGFRAEEYNRDKGKYDKFIQQDWIEFRHIDVLDLTHGHRD